MPRGHVRYLAFAIVLLACLGAGAAVVRMRARRAVPSRSQSSPLAVVETQSARPSDLPSPAPIAEGLESAPSIARTSLTAKTPLSPILAKHPSPSSANALGLSASAEPPSALGAEARLLRRAIESLRTSRDPRLALELLDEHRRAFPDGALRANADLLRVDALLALERRADALALLDALALDSGPRADELLTTRAELRAANDCRAALHDFDRVLARPISSSLAERALRGRIVCRVRDGDRAGADPDLRAYVQRFPNAAFAARARSLLDGR
jgi:TolA-binding protein